MSIEEIAAFIMAFLGGGAFKSIVDYFIERRKKKDKFKELFERVHDVYKTLNYVKNNTDAKRVLIIKSENGGDNPTVDSILISTILYEVWDNPYASLKKSWRRQRVDEYYINIARELQLNNSVLLNVMDLPDSLLRDVYIRSGVNYTTKYKVANTKNSFIHIELHFEDKPNISPRHRDIMRVAVNTLEDIFTGTGA